MLHVADKECIEAARKLFSHTFGVGCQNISPHKGYEAQKLLYGDIVNLVNVISPENQEARQAVHFKEFIIAQGVESVFELQRRLLSIRVRYSSHKAESPLVQNILGLQQPLPAPLPAAAGNWTSVPIAIGKNFILRGELVVAIRCDNNAVIVRHEQTGVEESIEPDLARNLIRRHILGISFGYVLNYYRIINHL